MAMDDGQVNELGLLSYNYDVQEEHVSGSIDDSGTNDSTDTKKTRKISNPFSKKKDGDIDNQNLIQSNPNNQNSLDGGVSADSKMGECSRYCRGLFYWIPIRQLCLVGSLFFLIFPFIGSYKDNSLGVWLMAWYIQVGSLAFYSFSVCDCDQYICRRLRRLMHFSDIWNPRTFPGISHVVAYQSYVPSLYHQVLSFLNGMLPILQKVQLKVFFYARFLRRTSGRALFYFSVSLCCFASVHETGVTVTMFAGIYMMMISLLMVIFANLAAKQLHEMYSYMRHNGQIDGDQVDDIDNFNQDEEAHLKQRFLNYYTQIDSDRRDKIGSKQLHHFATQALQRNLSNAGMFSVGDSGMAVMLLVHSLL